MKPHSPTRAGGIVGNPASVEVVGARVNNLRNLTCSFERHKMVCVCGISGSGKSSLLFSVLATEAEARHEALLPNTRRKEETARAPAEAVVGLPFCVTVSRRVLRAQKRSTVATQTGIHHEFIYLVRSFGRIRCGCGWEVKNPSAQDLINFACKKGGTVQIFSVLFRHGVGGSMAGPRTAHERGRRMLKQPDGSDDWMVLPPRGSLDDALAAAAYVGEYQAASDLGPGITEAMAQAEAGVLLIAFSGSSGKRPSKPKWKLDSSREWPCPSCNAIHLRATPSLLSFNSRSEGSGRCTRCAGLGIVPDVNVDLLVTSPGRSVFDGALGLERLAGSFRYLSLREDTLRGTIRRLGSNEKQPWNRLPEIVRNAILLGTLKREQPLNLEGKKAGSKVHYHGLVPLLIKVSEKPGEAGDYARSFVGERNCPECNGTRFDQELVGKYEYQGAKFTALLSRSVSDARRGLIESRGNDSISPEESAILVTCGQKLRALERSGLAHLTLDRSTASLSGGELQRLKISRSLVGGLSGACYILDEPSLGLHATDNAGLIENLRELRDAGNTVILADHDPDFIEAADDRVFLGPGAGRHGGLLLKHDVHSAPPTRRPSKSNVSAGMLCISGCSLHNIRDQKIVLPLGKLVCLSGVSGSGKSTFAKGILEPALKAALLHGRFAGPAWKNLSGINHLRTVVAVGQTVLGRSRRSLVMTYAGLAEPIRELLVKTETASQREYRAAAFSCNRAEGWCPICLGLGSFAGEESTDTAQVCDACRGNRFRDAILDCRWKERNIAQILDMEVSDAAILFVDEKEIAHRLTILQQLGLGHLKLGRSTNTLSGGEAQRLKLGAGLAETGATLDGVLFILDEPTAGLHGQDVQALLNLIDDLLANGRNSVVIIEHDLGVIRASDFVLDFGPGSGAAGGQVVVSGSPADIMRCEQSLTGAALRKRVGHKYVSGAPATRQSDQLVEPPSAAAAAVFSGFLHEHYFDEERLEGNDSASIKTIRPVYVLGESEFPPGRKTLLEAFRLTSELDRCLQPLLYLAPETPTIMPVSGESLDSLVREIESNKARLAWTLASDLIGAGRATRTALSKLLAHAKETGARWWTDQTGVLRPIEFDDFTSSDPFHVCVLAEGRVDGALVKKALQFGSGWIRALTQSTRERFTVHRHFVERPLSLSRKCLGGRALRTGLGPRHNGNACPYCNGIGMIKECSEDLIVSRKHMSPTHSEFYTPPAKALLQALFGRLQKTLEFFALEGIAELRIAGARLDKRDWQIMMHGYPWAQFLIPGRRASQKTVDYYQWSGLFPLILERLHLSKDSKWRERVELSVSNRKCQFCLGSGLDWPLQHTILGNEKLLLFLSSTNFAALESTVKPLLHCENTLRIFIEAACYSGLGDVRLSQKCSELNRQQHTIVRGLALKHLAFPEAGYVLPTSDVVLSKRVPIDMTVVFGEKKTE